MGKVVRVGPKETADFFKEFIDQAVAERNIEWLGGLIRKPPQSHRPEITWPISSRAS
jgi:hypothetical protein